MPIPDVFIWPAIAISREIASQEELLLGQSRFGGLPDVAAGFEWPRFRNRPLAFLAQINLADIAHMPCSIDLPKAGTLLFFYDSQQETWGFDPMDRGSSCVFHTAAASADLVRQHLPADMPPEGIFKAAKLTFKEIVSPPDELSIWVDERIDQSKQEDDYSSKFDGNMHQIGGHSRPIQNEMETQCELVTNGIYCGGPDGYHSEEVQRLTSGAFEWRCLLQLDSDDDLGWMWGDVGRLYFWIKESDARKRQFSKSWLILQCG
jgi:uncharacterized protein YwqG